MGSGPARRHSTGVEDGHGIQVTSSNLDVEELVDIANSLSLAH